MEDLVSVLVDVQDPGPVQPPAHHHDGSIGNGSDTGRRNRSGTAQYPVTTAFSLAQVRICVIGAGAIGGLLAARLSLSGNDVSVLARGESLSAIERGGIILVEPDGSRVVA
ncbi:MAG: hypothetical protein M0Z40_17355, partial [Actinomycetota bacterium]|nr:hypothetical protein [Actinomycetota bacterium]